MFSNVGIILLVIIYTIGGAFIFQAIEIFEYDRRYGTEGPQIKAKEVNYTKLFEDRLWIETSKNISFYDRRRFKKK